MADSFTTVLTFGPWVCGIYTPDGGTPYLKVFSSDEVPSSGPQDIVLPAGQWDVVYNETGPAVGWADGVHDLGMGITLTIVNEVYTATGTPV